MDEQRVIEERLQGTWSGQDGRESAGFTTKNVDCKEEFRGESRPWRL